MGNPQLFQYYTYRLAACHYNMKIDDVVIKVCLEVPQHTLLPPTKSGRILFFLKRLKNFVLLNHTPVLHMPELPQAPTSTPLALSSTPMPPTLKPEVYETVLDVFGLYCLYTKYSTVDSEAQQG